LATQADKIILVHGEPDSQDIFAGIVEEKYGKKPFIPQLGETFLFTAENIERILPDHDWLPHTKSVSIESKAVQNHEPQFQTIPLKLERKVSQSQINRAYLSLQKNLKALIDQGQREHQLEQVLNYLDYISEGLNEFQHQKR
jgi:metallo-beta-lactamase family protein